MGTDDQLATFPVGFRKNPNAGDPTQIRLVERYVARTGELLRCNDALRSRWLKLPVHARVSMRGNLVFLLSNLLIPFSAPGVMFP